jgi:hypothetical protein
MNAAPYAVDVTYHLDPDACTHWRRSWTFDPTTGYCRGHWPIDARQLPDELTYTGADGQRHYARIIARHDDGSATVSRGYYGTARVRFTNTDDPQPYRGGY